MEGLAPTLQFILGLRLGLERGESVRIVVQGYLKHHTSRLRSDSDDLIPILSKFITLRDQGRLHIDFFHQIKSHHRRMAFQLVDRGLGGDSILSHVKVLETEIHEACTAEMDIFVSQLPFKVLLPLVLFIFPAFMLLLLGPLVSALLTSI